MNIMRLLTLAEGGESSTQVLGSMTGVGDGVVAGGESSPALRDGDRSGAKAEAVLEAVGAVATDDDDDDVMEKEEERGAVGSGLRGASAGTAEETCRIPRN
jgi:hypothetical protein